MNSDFKKIFCMTIVIDIVLLIILRIRKLSLYEYWFISNILLCHFAFVYGLYKDDYDIIDPAHYALFIILAFCVYIVNDVYFLFLCLCLIFLIQVLWVIEGRCILNKKEVSESFGYGKELSIFVLLNTIVISYKLGSKTK